MSDHANRRHTIPDLVDARRRRGGAGCSHPLLWPQAGWLGQLGVARPGHSVLCVGCLDAFAPSTGRKSLANLGEPIYISFAMPVLALLRVAIGKRSNERAYAAGFISVLCVIAATVFFMVPFKPE